MIIFNSVLFNGYFLTRRINSTSAILKRHKDAKKAQIRYK